MEHRRGKAIVGPIPTGKFPWTIRVRPIAINRRPCFWLDAVPAAGCNRLTRGSRSGQSNRTSLGQRFPGALFTTPVLEVLKINLIPMKWGLPKNSKF